MLRPNLLLVPLIVLFAACHEAPTTALDAGSPAFKNSGPTDPTATWKIPLADAGLGFRSDGGSPDGTYSVYADGVCGVSAKIFATAAASNSGDATIKTDKVGNCVRHFTLSYPDNVSESVRSFNNLLQLENTGFAIAIGNTVNRRLIVAPGALANNPSRCGRLLFGPNGTVAPGSDSVAVTRIDASTWQVQSQAGHNLAFCETNGQLYAMSVSFVVVSSTPLP